MVICQQKLMIRMFSIMQCIPSSSKMVTVVDEGATDRLGPVGVTVERLTVNSWSSSRLLSFIIPNVAQAVAPTTSPLEKVTCRDDGSLKSWPSTERINVCIVTTSMFYNLSRLVYTVHSASLQLTYNIGHAPLSYYAHIVESIGLGSRSMSWAERVCDDHVTC